MRYLLPSAVALALLSPGWAAAQPREHPKIEKVRVGFRPYNENLNFGRYKIGLWTPVYVEITAGSQPLGGEAFLHIEASDFEDVGTIYRTPVRLAAGETGMFVAYTKVGNGNGEMKVELQVGNRSYRLP